MKKNLQRLPVAILAVVLAVGLIAAVLTGHLQSAAGFLGGAASTSGANSGTQYSVSPGKSRCGAINIVITNAAADAAANGVTRTVYLQDGKYYCETPIILKSSVTVKGVGDNTIIIPTFTGGADTATNYVLGADSPTSTSVINTTLNGTVSAGKTSLVVTSAGTVAAGNYVLVQGHNDAANDAPNQSDAASVILSEVMQVDSTYVSGTTLPVAWSTRVHHVTGTTVKGVTPVVNAAVRDLQIQGGQGGVTTAVGVFAQYALGFEVSGLTVSGTSRSAVELVGVGRFKINTFRSAGNNNSWLQLFSSQDGSVAHVRGTRGTARNNAAGVPRFPIYLRFRCTGITLDDIIVEGTTLGIFQGGGHHIAWSNIVVRDVEITQAVYDALVSAAEWQSNGRIPLGWGSGYPDITTYAEYAHDVQINNIRVESLRAPVSGALWTTAPYGGMAYYFSDVRELEVTNISAVSRGKVPTVIGVVVTDMVGKITNLHVTGMSYGLFTQNTTNLLQVRGYYFDGVASDGGNSTIGLYFDHNTATRIRLDDVSMVNCFGYVRFGGTFASSVVADNLIKIHNYQTDDGEWSDVIVARYAAASPDLAPNDVVEIDPTNTNGYLTVRDPDTGVANYQRRLAVVASGTPYDVAHATALLVAPLPQSRATVKATSAVIAPGDSLVLSGTRNVAADNTLDGSPRIGTALSYKAVGSAGIIWIGPVGG